MGLEFLLLLAGLVLLVIGLVGSHAVLWIIGAVLLVAFLVVLTVEVVLVRGVVGLFRRRRRRNNPPV